MKEKDMPDILKEVKQMITERYRNKKDDTPICNVCNIPVHTDMPIKSLPYPHNIYVVACRCVSVSSENERDACNIYINKMIEIKAGRLKPGNRFIQQK